MPIPHSVARIADSIPGFRWRVPVAPHATFDDWLPILAAYVDEHGHAAVEQQYRHRAGAGDRRYLGRWIARVRAHKVPLTTDQRAVLEALPGWSWTAEEARQARMAGELAVFYRRQGRLPAKVELQRARRLWKLRRLIQSGKLCAAAMRCLTTVPGFGSGSPGMASHVLQG